MTQLIFWNCGTVKFFNFFLLQMFLKDFFKRPLHRPLSWLIYSSSFVRQCRGARDEFFPTKAATGTSSEHYRLFSPHFGAATFPLKLNFNSNQSQNRRNLTFTKFLFNDLIRRFLELRKLLLSQQFRDISCRFILFFFLNIAMLHCWIYGNQNPKCKYRNVIFEHF